MIRNALAWARGWRDTLVYRHKHPAEYRQLLEPVYFPDDFGEVSPPQ